MKSLHIGRQCWTRAARWTAAGHFRAWKIRRNGLRLQTLDEGTNVPERWVPATQFVCLRGAKIAGMIQVRRELNDYLRNYAGHIGYSVRPDERQQGIATWMLHNVLTYCREIGLKRVMVACEPWNVGSRKTILRNGGVYEKTVHEDGENIDLEHYWISLT